MARGGTPKNRLRKLKYPLVVGAPGKHGTIYVSGLEGLRTLRRFYGNDDAKR